MLSSATLFWHLHVLSDPKIQHRSNNNNSALLSHNSTINKRRTTPSAMAGCVPPFYMGTHTVIYIQSYMCVRVFALFQLTWNTAEQQRRKIKNKVPTHKNNANHSCCPLLLLLLLLLLSLLLVTVALQAITITTISSARPMLLPRPHLLCKQFTTFFICNINKEELLLGAEGTSSWQELLVNSKGACISQTKTGSIERAVTVKLAKN